MKNLTTKENVEGGSPSTPTKPSEKKHKDDSAKPSSVVKKDAIRKSEKGNMNGKKGYNETPSNVPVKSSTSK